jgi:cobaltochelatase CobN
MTNFMKLDLVEEKCGEIMGLLLETGFDAGSAEDVIDKAFGLQSLSLSDSVSSIQVGSNQYVAKKAGLSQVLKFACTTVKPKLDAVTDEIKYFTEGIKGRFVPPGGSGCPTRGRVSILPTGRNFYSIDPAAIPTRAAWEVGMRLGDGLMERFLKDEGKYPEGIVMVVYGGETMKTCGDDIAEALYLMGVKPKWLENSDRVTGLEVIPYEILGHPRVDVTLRITGLFRDTFPNIIELVEDAVNLAASLEEDEEANYIRRNILRDIGKLKGEGLTEDDAVQQAGMRIFGCPPGTYGAGVDILINSKNWKDSSDLGNIYTTWGGHAYGRKIHGLKVRNAFADRLAAADATVKNESSMEIDMLESDDYYNYHGGLISAVKTHSGKMPRSYSGDSSDPSRTKIKNVNEETARIMRARIMNPKWFEGLKKHGYKGAQEIAAMVDIVFGWDATSEVVEDWMYDKITENYLFDDEKREWIKSVNPWAIHSMTERLLEASQRGMWNASEETLEKLKGLYLDIEGNIEDLL